MLAICIFLYITLNLVHKTSVSDIWQAKWRISGLFVEVCPRCRLFCSRTHRELIKKYSWKLKFFLECGYRMDNRRHGRSDRTPDSKDFSVLPAKILLITIVLWGLPNEKGLAISTSHQPPPTMAKLPVDLTALPRHLTLINKHQTRLQPLARFCNCLWPREERNAVRRSSPDHSLTIRILLPEDIAIQLVLLLQIHRLAAEFRASCIRSDD